ncbi:hypothetical protein [uncultured Thiodictyon sp.]|uniref:hypothetical protein n=1 Tax=uncultured Thiodictyon sp. TaxID=1846217 RepID=UPI0025E13659|nr:hypothetical protein [uncultured Thiodictyon sp.]
MTAIQHSGVYQMIAQTAKFINRLISPDLLGWGYLSILLLSYTLVGWMLAAFQVPWWIWLVTFAVTLHLIRSGPAAIALASTWVTGVMFVAAVMKAWTPLGNSRLPYSNAQLWALGLLGIWIGAIGCVVLLAGAPQFVTRALGRPGKHVAYALVLLVVAAMAGGRLVYWR